MKSYQNNLQMQEITAIDPKHVSFFFVPQWRNDRIIPSRIEISKAIKKKKKIQIG